MIREKQIRRGSASWIKVLDLSRQQAGDVGSNELKTSIDGYTPSPDNTGQYNNHAPCTTKPLFYTWVNNRIFISSEARIYTLTLHQLLNLSFAKNDSAWNFRWEKCECQMTYGDDPASYFQQFDFTV